MLTPAAERVAEHARRVVSLEVELALLEVKRKVAALGVGIGLIVVGAVLGLSALGFALAAAAAGLATVLPTWAALLVVAGGLFLTAGLLAAVGVASLKKASPPLPEQAILEA